MSLAFPSIQSTSHPFLRAELHYDHSPCPPSMCGAITYNPRSRYVLGTEVATADEDDAIAKGIRTGSMIGTPVWAYVHGGASLTAAETNPYHCQWDSGRSGYVYITKEAARAFFGVKRMTKTLKERVLNTLRADVEEFSAYLNGEVYGFVIRDTRTDEALDSCWGYYGEQFLREEATRALQQMESLTPCQLELAFNEGE